MDNKQYGLDITSKTDLVGICYTMWFNAVHGSGNTPIGYVPKAEDIMIEGLEDITIDTIRDLLTVDVESWLADIDNIKEFYAQVGDHVPAIMHEELAALESRLNASK